MTPEELKELGFKKAGNAWKVCCPLHKERTASCLVRIPENDYYCFGCGASGSADELIAIIKKNEPAK